MFAPKLFVMTLQKWIKDRAIHGFPTFSIEDVRETEMYSSEQILQNELYRMKQFDVSPKNKFFFLLRMCHLMFPPLLKTHLF